IRDRDRSRRVCKKIRRGEPRRWRGPVGTPKLQGEETVLREDDLDTAVLRLAYAWRRWNAQIVHAAAGDHHVAARDAETVEGGGGAGGGAPNFIVRLATMLCVW